LIPLRLRKRSAGCLPVTAIDPGSVETYKAWRVRLLARDFRALIGKVIDLVPVLLRSLE
jgi:hypothetical protein